MFFVRPDRQRRGIGRRLVKEAMANCRSSREGVTRLTVHSSPNAVAAYEHMGFQALGGEQEVNGIRFTLMALDLQDQAPSEGR
jgi:GNAT superfamily N-acetyltransferase